MEAALTKGTCYDDALGERTGSGRVEQSYRSGGNGKSLVRRVMGEPYTFYNRVFEVTVSSQVLNCVTTVSL